MILIIRRLIAPLLICVSLSTYARAQPAPGLATPDLVSEVNVRQGTDSTWALSNGNTLPLVARPFGMNAWALQNEGGGSWWFNPRKASLRGIRLTHQPSPWMGDYASLTVMAAAGAPDAPAMGADISSAAREQAFDPASLVLDPSALSLRLAASDVRIQFAPTTRAAVFRFTFPAGKTGRVILDVFNESRARIGEDARSFDGFVSYSHPGNRKKAALHFTARFDQAALATRLFAGGKVIEETRERRGPKTGVAFDFAPSADNQPRVVELTLGTSFIDAAQADRNATREVAGRGFDAVAAEGRAEWNQILGRVEIEATPEQRRTFYSCLYRAHLFPQVFHEFDAAGAPIHYSPYNGEVVPGVLYTNTGFWDTFRTVYPLLAILEPRRTGEMAQGWLNAYAESGWLPQWPSPGHRTSMIGTHSDAVLADAVVKKLPGFDPRQALAAMLKHATTPVKGEPGYGRPGLESYLKNGYIPNGVFRANASVTSDYAYDDFCIAQVARAVGDEATAAAYDRLSLNYRNLFDPKTGFLRGRDADGSFPATFDEFEWGGPYVESGPWQANWNVQHDQGGLIALHGGAAGFVRKLDTMFSLPGTFRPGTYQKPIHEMHEMARLPFGQYAHGNQPGHHAPYLFLAAGYPWKTQHWVRRILNEAYNPDAFSGDEDNGEMSSWYVLSALGIYPLCPGRPDYVLGSPLFRSARLRLEGGRTLRIEAPDNAPDRPFVRAVTLDGAAYDQLWISYFTLMQGAQLSFAMSDRPAIPVSPWRAEQLPPSLTPYAPDDLTVDPTLTTVP